MITLTPIYKPDLAQAGKEFFNPEFLTQRLARDGHWHGSGARLLRLANPVEPATFAALLREAEKARPKRAPGRRSEAPHPLGWRLTFDTPPRLNALWATADRGRGLLLEQGHTLGVKESLYRMEWLLAKAQTARRLQTEEIKPGCVLAAFRTGASADQTPRLTTTVFLFNLNVGNKGEPQAFTNEEVHRVVKALDPFYKDARDTAIRERLGPIPTFDHRDQKLARAAKSLDAHVAAQAQSLTADYPTLAPMPRHEHRRWQHKRWRRQGERIGWGPNETLAYLDRCQRQQAWARLTQGFRNKLATGVAQLRRVVTRSTPTLAASLTPAPATQPAPATVKRHTHSY